MEYGLSELKKSLSVNKFQDILDKIHSLKQKNDLLSLPLNEQIKYLYLEVQALLMLNNINKSLEVLNKFTERIDLLQLDKLEELILISLQINQLTISRSFDEAGKKVDLGKEVEKELFSQLSLVDKYWLTQFYDSIIFLAMKKLDYKSVIHYLKEQIAIFRKLNDNQNLYNSQDLLGIAYINLRQYDSAEEIFLENQSLIEIHNEIVRKNKALYGLGVIKLLKGNLDAAMEIFTKLKAFYHIAKIHRIRGDLDKALEHLLLESLKENDFYIRSWTILMELGEVNYLKNEHEQAFQYFKKSLVRGRKLFQRPPVVILFNLVRVCLDLNKTETAKKYYQEIVQINKDAKQDQFIEMVKLLSEGYILKKSNRMYEKGKALHLFKEVTDRDFPVQDLIILALMNQAEILLIELKAFEDPTILNELKQVIFRITEIANMIKSYSLFIDSLLIRSQVTLIEEDLDRALSYVDEAHNVIKEENVNYLQNKVDKFRAYIVDEFQKLQQKFEEGSTYYDRIQQLKIESYIQQAQKMIEFSNQLKP